MVSLAFRLSAVLLLDPLASSAEQVDWTQAGGGIFVEEPAPEVDEAEPGEAEPPLTRLSAPVQPWGEAVEAAATRHGLDPKLLHALVVVESGYQPHACSPAGACGLAQLMPATARELGVEDRFDPVASLDGGANYLARQLEAFGDVRLALAAYNAGPERVRRLGRIPQIAETQAYVAAVVDCYLALAASRRVRSSRDCASAKNR